MFNDLSLSEIAQEQGITRQGVHDLVRRCDRILESYENKLHLVEKFEMTKLLAGRIETLLNQYQKEQDASLLRQAEEVARKIVEI